MHDLLTVKMKALSRIPCPREGGGREGKKERGRERERERERPNLALVRKYQKPRGGSKIFRENAEGSSEC